MSNALATSIVPASPILLYPYIRYSERNTKIQTDKFRIVRQSPRKDSRALGPDAVSIFDRVSERESTKIQSDKSFVVQEGVCDLRYPIHADSVVAYSSR